MTWTGTETGRVRVQMLSSSGRFRTTSRTCLSSALCPTVVQCLVGLMSLSVSQFYLAVSEVFCHDTVGRSCKNDVNLRVSHFHLRFASILLCNRICFIQRTATMSKMVKVNLKSLRQIQKATTPASEERVMLSEEASDDESRQSIELMSRGGADAGSQPSVALLRARTAGAKRVDD